MKGGAGCRNGDFILTCLQDSHHAATEERDGGCRILLLVGKMVKLE